MQDLELSAPIEFEWDKYNQTKIRLRHGITTEQAEQTFFNEYSVSFDKRHSTVEQRYQLLGINDVGQVLFVVFTIRDNKIRIISARSASKKERSSYGKKA